MCIRDSFQNHLLTQEVDGYAGHTVDLLHGVLDFVSTMAAVPVSYTHLDVYKRQGYGCHGTSQ